MKTTLLPPVNDTCLLVIEEELALIATSLEFLTQVMGIAKQMYPNVRSLLPVYGPEYSLVLTGEIELHDVKVNND